VTGSAVIDGSASNVESLLLCSSLSVIFDRAAARSAARSETPMARKTLTRITLPMNTAAMKKMPAVAPTLSAPPDPMIPSA